MEAASHTAGLSRAIYEMELTVLRVHTVTLIHLPDLFHQYLLFFPLAEAGASCASHLWPLPYQFDGVDGL